MCFKMIGCIIERVATFGIGVGLLMFGVGSGLLAMLSAVTDEGV